ncbi:MAG: hypothetical protein ACRDBQ_23205 [Shewanella sp.]
MAEYNPEPGTTCLYKRKGGVNWCMCKVIAKYEKLIWIHNFYTGSKPVSRERDIEFKPLPNEQEGQQCK